MSLIELQDVAKQFANGVRGLDGVTLSFEAATVTVVLGPSGAGKSTLLRTINGLETPTSGLVKVDGVPVEPKSLREVRKRVGMVFQQFNLVPRLSVMANVLSGRLAHRGLWTSLTFSFPAEDYALAEEALRAVGLADRAWDRVDKLSGGQQQRVAIARTLVQQPKAILADEPVASLDPRTSVEVLDLLVGAARSRGTALILNLHQVDLARRFADRIVTLRAGRVVTDGPAASFTDEVECAVYAGDAACAS